MKVLVTGGSGRVGGYVLRDLLARGHVLRTFGRNPPLVEAGEHLTGELTDLAAVQTALRGQDAVMHLGAVSHPGRATPEDLWAANVTSTFNILEGAARAGVGKVVFASSEASLGFAFPLHPRAPRYFPLDEEHPCDPQDVYGLSKLVSEIMCRRYADAVGMQCISVRINSAWCLDRPGCEVAVRSGPLRGTPGGVEKLWGLYRQQIEHPEGPFPVPGPALPRVRLWGYTDARDSARAMRLALEAQDIGCDVMLTAAEDTVSREPTYALVHRYYPEVPLRGRLEGHTSLFSNARAERRLGYRPQYTWRNSDFAAWMAEQKEQ